MSVGQNEMGQLCCSSGRVDPQWYEEKIKEMEELQRTLNAKEVFLATKESDMNNYINQIETRHNMTESVIKLAVNNFEAKKPRAWRRSWTNSHLQSCYNIIAVSDKWLVAAPMPQQM